MTLYCVNQKYVYTHPSRGMHACTHTHSVLPTESSAQGSCKFVYNLCSRRHHRIQVDLNFRDSDLTVHSNKANIGFENAVSSTCILKEIIVFANSLCSNLDRALTRISAVWTFLEFLCKLLKGIKLLIFLFCSARLICHGFKRDKHCSTSYSIITL